MILYHYTSHGALASILEEGLTRGEVPLSNTERINAVNLTDDPDPSGHGLDHGGHILTEEESAILFAETGTLYPPGTVFTNKRAVRIRVKIPETDLRLRKFAKWAKTHIQKDYLDWLVNTAAGGWEKADTWYLYFGPIAPSKIVGFDILETEDEGAS